MCLADPAALDTLISPCSAAGEALGEKVRGQVWSGACRYLTFDDSALSPATVTTYLAVFDAGFFLPDFAGGSSSASGGSGGSGGSGSGGAGGRSEISGHVSRQWPCFNYEYETANGTQRLAPQHAYVNANAMRADFSWLDYSSCTGTLLADTANVSVALYELPLVLPDEAVAASLEPNWNSASYRVMFDEMLKSKWQLGISSFSQLQNITDPTPISGAPPANNPCYNGLHDKTVVTNSPHFGFSPNCVNYTTLDCEDGLIVPYNSANSSCIQFYTSGGSSHALQVSCAYCVRAPSLLENSIILSPPESFKIQPCNGGTFMWWPVLSKLTSDLFTPSIANVTTRQDSFEFDLKHLNASVYAHMNQTQTAIDQNVNDKLAEMQAMMANMTFLLDRAANLTATIEAQLPIIKDASRTASLASESVETITELVHHMGIEITMALIVASLAFAMELFGMWEKLKKHRRNRQRARRLEGSGGNSERILLNSSIGSD